MKHFRPFASIFGASLALFAALPVAAQSNPSSFASPFYGSVPMRTTATAEPMQLTLDEAIRMGLLQNLGLREAVHQEESAAGVKQESLQALLPIVMAESSYAHREFNLAAQSGFRPGLLASLTKSFPSLMNAHFSPYTQAHILTGQLDLQQRLFSLSAFDTWRATGASLHSAYYQKMSARGEVVQRVATAYLAVLADQQNLEDAVALEKADAVLLDQAHERHINGVAANLDELRARVQDQSQQQAVTAATNALAKDEILLGREIGLPPAQAIRLTDAVPYVELAAMTPPEAMEIALRSRQDWQSLGYQLQAAHYQSASARHERLPVLSFQGNYGVTATTGGVAHGTMAAMTTLNVPIFREAGLRGEAEVANANLTALRLEQSDLREQMDQQVRDALLDVAATAELVRVAQSNVELATRALSDTTDRYNAGIDDNLPVVEAQAALADAQARKVSTLYQFNLAKLQLARSTGVLETQYRSFLGR